MILSQHVLKASYQACTVLIALAHALPDAKFDWYDEQQCAVTSRDSLTMKQSSVSGTLFSSQIIHCISYKDITTRLCTYINPLSFIAHTDNYNMCALHTWVCVYKLCKQLTHVTMQVFY